MYSGIACGIWPRTMFIVIIMDLAGIAINAETSSSTVVFRTAIKTIPAFLPPASVIDGIAIRWIKHAPKKSPSLAVPNLRNNRKHPWVVLSCHRVCHTPCCVIVPIVPIVWAVWIATSVPEAVVAATC